MALKPEVKVLKRKKGKKKNYEEIPVMKKNMKDSGTGFGVSVLSPPTLTVF